MRFLKEDYKKLNNKSKYEKVLSEDTAPLNKTKKIVKGCKFLPDNGLEIPDDAKVISEYLIPHSYESDYGDEVEELSDCDEMVIYEYPDEWACRKIVEGFVEMMTDRNPDSYNPDFTDYDPTDGKPTKKDAEKFFKVSNIEDLENPSVNKLKLAESILEWVDEVDLYDNLYDYTNIDWDDIYRYGVISRSFGGKDDFDSPDEAYFYFRDEVMEDKFMEDWGTFFDLVEIKSESDIKRAWEML